MEIKRVDGKFGVDAGNISVVDIGFIEEHGGKVGKTAEHMCETIQLEKGKYHVSLEVRNSWRGNIKEHFDMHVKSGRVGIGDICYYFSSGETEDSVWDKFLEKTNYFKELGENGSSADTGGDGHFSVSVKFKKI